MGRINVGKMIAGGILAGVIMNIFDFVANNYLLASDWRDVAQARNIDMLSMGSTAALIPYAIADMAFGFLLVYAYAAIRPRFGPGPRTATRASVIIFLAWALGMATLAGLFFPWRVYVRSTFLELIAMMAAGWAGAWVYAEDEGTDEEG